MRTDSSVVIIFRCELDVAGSSPGSNPEILHLNDAPMRAIQTIVKERTIPTMLNEIHIKFPDIACKSCRMEKLTNHSTTIANLKHHTLDSYVSSDTCGLIYPISRRRNKRPMTFNDVEPRHWAVGFLKNRSQIPNAISKHMAYILALTEVVEDTKGSDAVKTCLKKLIRPTLSPVPSTIRYSPELMSLLRYYRLASVRVPR